MYMQYLNPIIVIAKPLLFFFPYMPFSRCPCWLVVLCWMASLWSSEWLWTSLHLSCIGLLKLLFCNTFVGFSAVTTDLCLQHRHLNFSGITTEQYILLQIQPMPSTVCEAAITKHTEIYKNTNAALTKHTEMYKNEM